MKRARASSNATIRAPNAGPATRTRQRTQARTHLANAQAIAARTAPTIATRGTRARKRQKIQKRVCLTDLPEETLRLIFEYVCQSDGRLDRLSVRNLMHVLALAEGSTKLLRVFRNFLHTFDLLYMRFHGRPDCQQLDDDDDSFCALGIQNMIRHAAPFIKSLSLPRRFLNADRRFMSFVSEKCSQIRRLTFHDSAVMSMRAAKGILSMENLRELTVITASARFISELAARKTQLRYLHIAGPRDNVDIDRLTTFLRSNNQHQLETFVVGVSGNVEELSNVDGTLPFELAGDIARLDNIYGVGFLDHVEVMNADVQRVSNESVTLAFAETCAHLIRKGHLATFKVSKLGAGSVVSRCDSKENRYTDERFERRCVSFARAGLCSVDVHLPVLRVELLRHGAEDLERFVRGIQPRLASGFYCMFRCEGFTLRLPPRVARLEDVGEENVDKDVAVVDDGDSNAIQGRDVIYARLIDLVDQFHPFSVLSQFSALHEVCVGLYTPFRAFKDSGLLARLKNVVISASLSVRRVRLGGLDSTADFDIAERVVSEILCGAIMVTMVDLSSAYLVPLIESGRGRLERFVQRLAACEHLKLIHMTFDENANFRCAVCLESFVSVLPAFLQRFGRALGGDRSVCIDLHCRPQGAARRTLPKLLAYRLRDYDLTGPAPVICLERALCAVDAFQKKHVNVDVICLRLQLTIWQTLSQRSAHLKRKSKQ